jgi:transposase
VKPVAQIGARTNLYRRTISNSIVGRLRAEPECMRSIEVRYIVRRESSSVDVLGIDVSKVDFHACLIQGGQRSKKSFPNAAAGYRQLQSWLKNRRCGEVHACMEATGAYWMGLATALHDRGAVVSVVNPSQTVFFARSQLRRTKTDSVDAEMIAEFCEQRQPARWAPPPPEILELRGLLSYRRHLTEERTRLKQLVTQIHASARLQALHRRQLKELTENVKAIESQLRALVARHQMLDEQVRALTKVAGFGLLTALSIVAQLPVDRLRNAKAAAAYVGLAPSERQSGTSIHAKPRICKIGNGDLRRDLFMPAVAIRYNAILRAFAERLKERGKPAKVVITAVMRKLVVLAFTILKRLMTAKEALASA